jgi:hypothetical protein
VDGTVVVVDVEVDVDLAWDGRVVPPPCRLAIVVDGWATVEDEGAATCGLLPPEKARAIAPTTTSTATTATDATSQRSGDRAASGARSVGLTGRCQEWEGGGGPPPADSRARRAALSIAPSARRPGVPSGGSSDCPSVIRSSSRFFPESAASTPAAP